MLLQLNSPGEGTPRDSSKAAAPPGEEVGGEEANDEVREGILVSFDDTAAPRVDQRVVLSKASDENDDTPPGGEDLREASSGSNQMDDEDEWETVQVNAYTMCMLSVCLDPEHLSLSYVGAKTVLRCRS